MPEILPAGKLPGALLQRLISQHISADPSVLIGPEVGADAAAIRPSDQSAIVVKTDPITFPTPDAARYLVNVNANDIACMGGTPRWLLVTALLPEGSTTAADVESLFRNLAIACQQINVTVVGGHTEITDSVNRPVLVGTLLGEALETSLLDLRRSRPGDKLLLANTIAIEGTAILAGEASPDALAGVDESLVVSARSLIDDPGLSVIPAARSLISSGVSVRGLHDPTEGGIATAILEVATVSGCDIELERTIPIRDDTVTICDVLQIDPLGLIASGALLAVVPATDIETACEQLRLHEIPATVLGTLISRSGPAPLLTQHDGSPLPRFEVDEIARFFSSQ